MRAGSRRFAASSSKWTFGIALALAIAMVDAQSAFAAFPDRPITLIVPWNPGGSTDLAARPLAQAAEKYLGQPIVIVNKPGGSTTIGMRELARAKPDGYTIGTLSSATYMAPLTGIPAGYDPVKSFSFISYFGDNLIGIVVLKDARWKTLQELVDEGKRHPGAISYGAPGISSTQNLMTKALQEKSGAKFVFVPYTGSPDNLAALLRGDVGFITEVSIWSPYATNGQVRVLAINMPDRINSLPNVPTLRELGYPSFRSVQAIIGPAGIPEDRRKMLENAFRKALTAPAFVNLMDNLHMITVDMSGSATKAVVEDEIAKAKAFLSK